MDLTRNFATRVALCALVTQTLTACMEPSAPQGSDFQSLTTQEDDAKTGRAKYYFGFRDILAETEMNNETLGDVEHVKRISTNANGGGYVTNPAFQNGYLEARGKVGGGSAVTAEWQRITSLIKPGDMFLEMSAGHGYRGGGQSGGVEIGVTHQQVKNAALAMLDKGAQEVVIFMMACYSGGVVEAFRNDKQIQNYRSQGKTIFVMSSSTTQEESSTLGEGDQTIKGGAAGTGGSAFGNALWKAWRGDADKTMNGGNDDGIVSLGEIAAYSTKLTKAQGGHTPQVLEGFYDPNLPMFCIKGHPKTEGNPYCRGVAVADTRALSSTTSPATSPSTSAPTMAPSPTPTSVPANINNLIGMIASSPQCNYQGYLYDEGMRIMDLQSMVCRGANWVAEGGNTSSLMINKTPPVSD